MKASTPLFSFNLYGGLGKLVLCYLAFVVVHIVIFCLKDNYAVSISCFLLGSLLAAYCYAVLDRFSMRVYADRLVKTQLGKPECTLYFAEVRSISQEHIIKNAPLPIPDLSMEDANGSFAFYPLCYDNKAQGAQAVSFILSQLPALQVGEGIPTSKRWADIPLYILPQAAHYGLLLLVLLSCFYKI